MTGHGTTLKPCGSGNDDDSSSSSGHGVRSSFKSS
jgi:hypothetical protein